MRDAYIDNAKGILIFLVVFGHFLEKTTQWHWDYQGIKYVLTVLFMFHVPAFVFFAGLTAKVDNLSLRVLRLFIMYVLFQGAYMVFMHFYDGSGVFSFIRPYWLVWFLLAMCFWYAMLPVFRAIRFPVTISVLISIFSGTFSWSGYEWTLSRVMVFLPFFVIGNLHGHAIIDFVKKRASWRVLAGVMIPVLGYVLYKNLIENTWLYGTFNYQWMKIDYATGVVTRLVVDAFAIISVLCFLCAVPKRESFITAIGRNSLSVYLLHGFFVLSAFSILATLPASMGQPQTIVVCVFAALAVTAVAGMTVVDASIRRFTDLSLRPILK